MRVANEHEHHDDDRRQAPHHSLVDADLVVTRVGAVYHVAGCPQIAGRVLAAFTPGMQRTLSDGRLVDFRPCGTCRPPASGRPRTESSLALEHGQGWTPDAAAFERLMWSMLGATAATVAP
jgi:hypothetical protein